MNRVRAVLVAGLAALVAGCSPSSAPPPTPEPTVDLIALRESYGLPDCPDTDPAAAVVPDGLPVTSLPCLGSDKVVNLAGLPRKLTVINLWAQWCQPCRQESPFLKEVSADRPDIAFVGINYQDPKPDWAIEFAGLVEWKYPHVQDMERSLQTSLRVPGLPTTLFVDATGAVVGRHAGPVTSTAQLEGLIDEFLGQP